MYDLISSNLSNILVGAVVCGLVALVVVKMIKDKKNNVKSCCSGCSNKSMCHPSGEKN